MGSIEKPVNMVDLKRNMTKNILKGWYHSLVLMRSGFFGVVLGN